MIRERVLAREMSDLHGFDYAAIWALISLRTDRTFQPSAGLDTWTPKTTASGLLGWTEGSLRALGVPETSTPPAPSLGKFRGSWRSWELLAMSYEDQLELVARFFKNAFLRIKARAPIDYYLAVWGAAPGLPDASVISLVGEQKYRRVLDRDRDGKIQVRDLRLHLEGRMLEEAVELPSMKSRRKAPQKLLTGFDVLCSLGFTMLGARL